VIDFQNLFTSSLYKDTLLVNFYDDPIGRFYMKLLTDMEKICLIEFLKKTKIHGHADRLGRS